MTMMVQTLTTKERNTINTAVTIMLSRLPKGASWLLTPRNFHGEPGLASTTYFSSIGNQHSDVPGKTLADKVAWACKKEASAEQDRESARLLRVERLRKELADLEAAA